MTDFMIVLSGLILAGGILISYFLYADEKMDNSLLNEIRKIRGNK